MTVADRSSTFTAEAARELSSVRGEPKSAQDLRARSWNAYENFPIPSREDEAWRRTDISRLAFDRFELSFDPFRDASDIPSFFSGSVGAEEGLLLLQDGEVFRRLPKDLADKGLVFTDLSTALRDHRELVERRLLQAVSPRRGKFEALNGALWNAGIFLYVPKGLDVPLLLRGGYGGRLKDGQALLPHTLIVVEEGARVTYFDEYVSPAVEFGKSGSSPEAISCGETEIFLAPSAEMTYVNIQRWGNGVHHFLSQNALLQRDARLTTLAVALGGTLSKVNMGSELLGAGASSQLYGVVFGDGRQHFTHHTYQDHQVPNTSSDLLFKAALKDRARSVYTGMIRITKEAQKTSAYQSNRNLLLSPDAKANTIPMLEILADDVKCGHGASVGSLDDDQRFYLMSRGLSKSEAERIIVEGFFDEVLQRIPAEATREKLLLAVNDKLFATRT